MKNKVLGCENKYACRGVADLRPAAGHSTKGTSSSKSLGRLWSAATSLNKSPSAASPTCAASCLLQAHEDLSSSKSLRRFGAQRHKQMVSAAGFEPATHALKGRCSTN